jgi:hypothetical protein
MSAPHALLTTIPLLEAQASSEIENIVTTADGLFRQAQRDGAQADPAVKETLRYRAALWDGLAAMRGRALSVATAIEVCSEIKGRPMDIRALPVTRIADATTGRIVYWVVPSSREISFTPRRDRRRTVRWGPIRRNSRTCGHCSCTCGQALSISARPQSATAGVGAKSRPQG